MSADPPQTPAPATPSTTRHRTELAFSPRFSTISVRGDVVGGDNNERRRSSTGGEERRSSGATPFGTIYAGTPPKTLRECYASALEHETAKTTSLSREVGPSAKRPPTKKKKVGIADVTNREPRRSGKPRQAEAVVVSHPPLR